MKTLQGEIYYDKKKLFHRISYEYMMKMDGNENGQKSPEPTIFANQPEM